MVKCSLSLSGSLAAPVVPSVVGSNPTQSIYLCDPQRIVLPLL